MNILVVVPHPDDEVLGFGGVIQKHVASGDKVFVDFITEIRTKRLEEQFKQFPEVGRKLGYVGRLHQTFLTDAALRTNIHHLETEIDRLKPDVLYSVFGGDNHQDHRYIFDLVRIATRVWSNFLVKKIYLGEILSSTDQSPRLPQFAFLPTMYVPLLKDEVEKKIKCMEIYQDEIQEWPHPRSKRGVMNLAERRGSECRYSYAEAFVTLRDVNLFVNPKQS